MLNKKLSWTGKTRTKNTARMVCALTKPTIALNNAYFQNISNTYLLESLQVQFRRALGIFAVEFSKILLKLQRKSAHMLLLGRFLRGVPRCTVRRKDFWDMLISFKVGIPLLGNINEEYMQASVPSPLPLSCERKGLLYCFYLFFILIKENIYTLHRNNSIDHFSSLKNDRSPNLLDACNLSISSLCLVCLAGWPSTVETLNII